MGCIVVACNSGGPLESVEDGVTGFLREPTVEKWSQKISDLLSFAIEDREKMRKAA